jgi:hypothetical protein
MRLETETHRRRGVTLVAARVVNDGDHATRVRVADQCGGSVWPPREDGLPVVGWDDGGWEGVVDAGETRALGYATPAEPATPPAGFAWTERAADADHSPGERYASDQSSGEPTSGDSVAGEARIRGSDPTPGETLADLGDPRPPRDAIAPPATVLPDAVRNWLDRVGARAEAGDVTDADRERVAALGARATRLREVLEE